MKSMHLDTYRDMVKIGSFELKDKLKTFLTEEGYHKGYAFKNKELEALTGIKSVWWGNWKHQAIPAHIFLLLHINFDIDLKLFFTTGDLKKISREGCENACA